MSKVLALCISETKGVPKTPVQRAQFIVDFGMENDAHAGGEPLRQVSLLSRESVDTMRGKMPDLTSGDFAENLLIEGVDLKNLPLGTTLYVGDEVVLEVTQIGKKCHNSGCAIKKNVGFCIMPVEGIFAKVVIGGTVNVNDNIKIQ